MWTTGKSVRLILAVLVLAAGVAIQGCRQEEQGRMLSYEKGRYLGKADQKLSDAQRLELRQRARSGQQY